MKYFIFILCNILTALSISAHGGGQYVHDDFFNNLSEGDKAAILMVHFGTTHADTREQTIDKLNAKVSTEFPTIEVREAYTSRIIIKRLNDRGIEKQNPSEVLMQLHKDGFTHVLILSSNIIDGVEMESLHKNVEEVSAKFKDIRVSNPLLYAPEDYASVIDALAAQYNKETAYVWVGHGTYDATTAQYAMLDYMLKAKGHTNCFVGTVEGYPEFDDMLHQLKASGLKKVVLMPFMFVAGEHAKNDIAEDWKEALEAEGFHVEVCMKGLGEYPLIQNCYVDHLRFISKHRKLGIMEKKAVYANTGEKIH